MDAMRGVSRARSDGCARARSAAMMIIVVGRGASHLGCVYRIQVYTGEPQYSVYTGEYRRTPQMLVKIQAWLIGARVYGELPSFTEVASKPSWSTVT